MKLELTIILSQILAFLIMLVILKKFAWKPILKSLQNRQIRIQKEFDEAAQKQKSADELHQLYLEKLDHIEREAKQKIEEALLEGRNEARLIKEEAHAEARLMWKKTQEDLEAKVKHAEIELKDRIVHLVFLTTQKLLAEKMDEGKDSKMIEQILSKMQS